MGCRDSTSISIHCHPFILQFHPIYGRVEDLFDLPDELPDNLLSLMLRDALHGDSDLDARQMFPKLSSNPELEKNTMSVAENPKAEDRTPPFSPSSDPATGFSNGRHPQRSF